MPHLPFSNKPFTDGKERTLTGDAGGKLRKEAKDYVMLKSHFRNTFLKQQFADGKENIAGTQPQPGRQAMDLIEALHAEEVIGFFLDNHIIDYTG